MNRSMPRPLTVVVVGACLVLTLGLAWLTSTVDDHNNQHLLVQQAQQAAAALASQVPVVQSQLVDAAQVAVDTDADPAVFQRFTKPKISAGGPFDSVSLWKMSGTTAHQIALDGDPLALVSQRLDTAFFKRVHPGPQLVVTGILPGPLPRLGYAEMPPNDTSGLVVYAERFLPANRKVTMPASSPFGDLKFALYLGASPVESQLLEASGPLPIGGRTASVSVQFGDSSLTLVASPRKSLAGGLSAALPWIVLAVGALLAVASGSTVEYVGRRRALAETLAADNDRLYREQRDIAGTLQHALLPAVPSIDGVEIAARYLAGVAGIDVGGDWYDVISVDPHRCVFFVGDVSGRGLPAATTMASLRYAVRAYVAQGDDIETVLVKLGELLDIESDHRFATVLAGEVDLAEGRVRLASAGHFLPLLLTAGEAKYVPGAVDPPVGVSTAGRLTSLTVDVPPNATLVAFTDGVVERKGEHIDVGLERLRCAANADGLPLETLVDNLIAALIPDGAHDDAVILAIRRQN